jgi:uncharacterized protein
LQDIQFRFYKMKNNKETFSKEEIIKLISDKKNYLSDKYFVSEIGLFGSYVRGEQHKKSDIDILIDFNKYPNIFTFMELEEYLSDLLKAKVDLVVKDVLKPFIGNIIKKEVVYI